MDATSLSRLARAAGCVAVNHSVHEVLAQSRAENAKLREAIFRLVRGFMEVHFFAEASDDERLMRLLNVVLADFNLGPAKDSWGEMMLCARVVRFDTDEQDSAMQHLLAMCTEDLHMTPGHLERFLEGRRERLPAWGLTDNSTVAEHERAMQQVVSQIVLDAMD
jgi:hypothetical protein